MIAERITDSDRSIVALAWYLGYLVLLVTIPYVVPTRTDVSSAAVLAGYSTSAAFYSAVFWSLGGIALFSLIGTPGGDDRGRGVSYALVSSNHSTRRRRYFEIAFIFLLSFLLYFPPFLAKNGPYIEDGNILTILHRMHGGQIPYVDFLFLYSPLMIYPAHYWVKLFGYSMSSYYAYLALLVALQFAILIAVLQRFVPRPMTRYAIFLLVSAFLVETLLGINWIGLRRLLPFLALLLISTHPHVRRANIGAGLILGCALAYSHDYGIAGLIGAGAVYSLGLVKENLRDNIRSGTTVALVSVLVWFAVSFVLLGDAFPQYLQTASYLVKRYSAGEAGFRFYWTVNSIAVFALLWLACICVASGALHRRTRREIGAGDRMLFGSLACAFVLLRSGLNRSDFWHLDPVILGLVFAFLLPLRYEVFKISRFRHRLAHLLILVCAITYLVGSAPSGAYYFSNYVSGMRQTLAFAGETSMQKFDTPAPALLWERGEASSPHTIALARFLAERWKEGSRVLFYGETWSLGKIIGIYKTDPLMDDLLFSDEMGDQLTAYLEEDPNTLIVMLKPGYERLFKPAQANQFHDYDWYQATATKRIAAWLSSVHYFGVPLERRAIEDRLEKTVGKFIRANYTELAIFDDIIVLHREHISP